MWRDWKYSLSYTGYLSAYLGIYWAGAWSYLTPVYLFGIIPLLELLLPQDTKNLSPEEEDTQGQKKIFDWLLYCNLPLVYGLLGYFLVRVSHSSSLVEIIGMTLSMGMILGSMGINVAHELGHRKHRWERNIGKALLLSSLYMHFFIEHNRGHHKHVATKHDPATARRGENLYFFVVRSIVMSYLSAWRLEKERLEKTKQTFFSLHNEMLWYHFWEIALLVGIAYFFPFSTLVAFMIAALIGILLLEAVNYLEHYGLERQEVAPGKYEKLRACHSWNSDHVLGRILLYELTRHSDHHLKASKKYQTLHHLERSPELPTGYPGCILLALVPPLWFWLIHPRLPR